MSISTKSLMLNIAKKQKKEKKHQRSDILITGDFFKCCPARTESDMLS